MTMDRPIPAPRVVAQHGCPKPPVPKRMTLVSDSLPCTTSQSSSHEPIGDCGLSEVAVQDSRPLAQSSRSRRSGFHPPLPQKPPRFITPFAISEPSPSTSLSSGSDSSLATSVSPNPAGPPKPKRSSPSPALSPLSSPIPASGLITKSSLVAQRRSTLPADRYSTPSDILADCVRNSTPNMDYCLPRAPSASSTFDVAVGVNRSASPTTSSRYSLPVSESSPPPPSEVAPHFGATVLSPTAAPKRPERRLRKLRLEVTQPTWEGDQPGSILDKDVRHASSSINVYPDLEEEEADAAGLSTSGNLIDLSDEAAPSAPCWDLRMSDNGKQPPAGLPSENNDDSRIISPIDCLLADFEAAGVNGGIWNPGYIGLDEYRKLVAASEARRFVYDGSNKNGDVVQRREVVADAATQKDECESTASATGGVNGVADSGSLRLSFEVPNGTENGTCALVAGEAICYSGWVQLTLNKKERGRLWAVLRSQQLIFHSSEDEEDGGALGPFEMRNVIFVGCNPHIEQLVSVSFKEDVLSVHWHHLKMLSEHSSNHWALLLAKCIMPKHDTLLCSVRSVNAGGQVWIRQGATCPWTRGWMHIDQRKLFYVLDNCSLLFELDIRKFIALKSDIAKVDWCASVIGSQKGPFLLTLEGGSLYVQAECDTTTALWLELIVSEMECKGGRLEDHKLTADDVPIIVDKCVKFISTYGLFQPGLYRRNGSAVEARALMEDLKRDPSNVHIAPGSEDMVNVVADVLRTFFRQLDMPLIPYYMQDRLFAIAEIKDPCKMDEYHEVLMSLSRVRLQTVRRLLDHLKDVTEHAHTNLATVENIAKVFGPTLFSVDSGGDGKVFDGYGKTVQQVNVLKELITNYAIIFRVSVREMHAKTKMDLLHGKANASKARADGFLVPIHLLEKDCHTFNVQSSSTAEQVCEAARKRPSFHDEGRGTSYALFEVIKGGQLERRVGWQEKMSVMVTSRWLDWDPTDCFLVFKQDTSPFSFDQLYPFADDVKIAEPGSKSFSTAHLKLDSGTTVIHFNKSMKQQNEWHVDDILWYREHETSRKPPYPFTLTFVLPKKHFKYGAKFIGYCVAFKENYLRTQWLSAVLSAQQDFQPAPTPPLLQI